MSMTTKHTCEGYEVSCSSVGCEVWSDCSCGKRLHGYGETLDVARMLLRRDQREHGASV